MTPQLFGEATCPVTPRYCDPGDAPKKPQHRRFKSSGSPPERPATSPSTSVGQKTRKALERLQEKKNNSFRLTPFRQPIADQDEQEFRHMHWQHIRDNVLKSMDAAGSSSRAIEAFANCGAECMVEWSDEAQRYRCRASYCHCRHCKPCAKARSSIVCQNVQKRLAADPNKSLQSFRFITLTVRHSNRPLKEQLQKLNGYFRKLRNSKLWKNTQRGGYYSIETKWTEKGEWHPHLHVVSEGTYLQQAALCNLWSSITGGSFKVDIRKISNIKDVAYYVSKYVTKGVNDEVWHNTEAAKEWILASRGMRTCSTFGNWRGFKLLQPDAAAYVKDWKPVGLLTRIVDDARKGMQYAFDLLHCLADTVQFNPGKPRKSPRKPSD